MLSTDNSCYLICVAHRDGDFNSFWDLRALPVLGWLVGYLRFYVPLKNFSLIWRRHHCQWRAAKFGPMLCAQGLWACSPSFQDGFLMFPFVGILIGATPAVTRDLGFSGLIQRTAPFSHLLQHTRDPHGGMGHPHPPPHDHNLHTIRCSWNKNMYGFWVGISMVFEIFSQFPISGGVDPWGHI
jgi:hypothetical protein